MLLTGDSITATQAHHWGLVTRLVEGDDAKETALSVATTIASMPRAIITAGKRALKQQISQSREQAYK